MTKDLLIRDNDEYLTNYVRYEYKIAIRYEGLNSDKEG
jgi:hypothetical protein